MKVLHSEYQFLYPITITNQYMFGIGYRTVRGYQFRGFLSIRFKIFWVEFGILVQNADPKVEVDQSPIND